MRLTVRLPFTSAEGGGGFPLAPAGRRSLSAAPRRDTGLFSLFKGPSTIAQSGQLRAIEYR